jgi:hypothetical protein
MGQVVDFCAAQWSNFTPALTPANSVAMSNEFRGLDPAESKQNGKIKSRKTLENRAAAPAHI